MLGLGLGLNKLRSSGLSSFLKGAMIWGFRSKYKWSQTTPDIWGFANPTDIDPEAQAVYDRIIADGGVSNLTRLNYFVVGLKTIYGTLANVPICYDAHWIGYKLGSGTGATAGQAAAKLYSLTVAGDAVQSTAASQPLLLAHNGTSSDNYWYGSGVANNNVTTPNASANQITGDIEIIAKIEGVFTTGKRIVRKRDVGDNFDFYISDASATGLTLFLNSTIGVAASNANFTMISGGIWVKVTRTASNGDVKFFTSNDGITYTQLGATQSTVAGNLTSSTDVVQIGSAGFSASAMFQGKIYRATISNSIGGAPVVDFNPATYNASTSQTAWTSATGEVWTINTGTATVGYKGVLVSRTIVQADGTDDYMRSGSVTVNQPSTSYSSFRVLTVNSSNDLFTGQTVTTQNEFSAGGTLYAGLPASITSFNPARNLYSVNWNGASSNFKLNDNAISSNVNTGTQGITGLVLFGYFNNTYVSNANLYTLFYSNATDSGATRTATYNLVRSLNENAF